MASEFATLYEDTAVPLLVEKLGETNAAVVYPPDGSASTTYDAIIGAIRVEEEDVIDGEFEQRKKYERTVLSIPYTIADGTTILQESKIELPGIDSTKWSIESMPQTRSGFITLELFRPYLMARQRSEREK